MQNVAISKEMLYLCKIIERKMDRNLQMSYKMLASKQASKQASKHYSIIYNGRAVRPDEVSPCLVGA